MKTATVRPMTSASSPPVLRTVYLTDSPSALPAAAEAGATAHAPTPTATHAATPLTGPMAAPIAPIAHMAPIAAHVPAQLLSALGERLAAGIAAAQRGEPSPGPQSRAELERLERLGLQLQELTHIVARTQQLRQETVDLGLALLQTMAEWSAEADRAGAELHGPVQSVMVQANPAALKHLLDLVVEHALQQGRTVRLEIERRSGRGAPATVAMVAWVSSEPASSCPARETLAWGLLVWLARSLGLPAERRAVERGERLEVVLPGAPPGAAG